MRGRGPPPRTRQWNLHILIVIAVEFSAESARGLVLPTLFSYAEHLNGDVAFVGLLTALFSAGRFLSSLLFGWLCDHLPFKTLYCISASIAIVGNALYVLPYSSRIHSKPLLGVSRFLVGFGAGNRSVCRANVAALTRIDQRVSYFTMLATVVFLAYALTPGLGGVFGDIDVAVAGFEYIRFNRFTAPGFILVGLNLATIFIIHAVYDGSVTRADAPEPRTKLSISSTGPEKLERGPKHPGQSNLPGVFVFVFLNVVARGMLSIFETINVPLYLKTLGETHWHAAMVFEPLLTPSIVASRPRPTLSTGSSDVVAKASQFYLMIGLLGLLSYGAVHLCGGYEHRVSDRSFLLFGFNMLLFGNGLLALLCRLFVTSFPAKMELLVVAEIFVWSIGFPILSAVIVPAFSKLLGSRPQGFLMGLFGASASIARMTMPLLPSILPSWESLFSLNVGFCVCSIVALVVPLRSQMPVENLAEPQSED
jgi:MFS transporter, ceroid-lipofuscinosis neuronal protein 7